MSEEVLLILTTWPDVARARSAARTLVEEHLAACANIVPGVESIYRWQGAIETASEVLVILKSTIGRYQMLEARIKALHSYELPEIMAFRPSDGLPAYMQWVMDSA